ncbi:MAG: hypothetical protein IPI60_00235 [Saprospiraceae bacterium]|nr:hypothetical protein [Saprospiraceae bacterium]
MSSVRVTLPLDNSSKDCGATTHIGVPIKVESGMIRMNVDREVFNGIENLTKITNEKKFKRNYQPEISLNLMDARQITLNSKTSKNITGVGRLLITFGSLTALVVAPLVSINYAEGGFNSERYFKVAGVGLAGVAVGIPLILLAKPKTYVLKEFSGNEKEIWSIVK